MSDVFVETRTLGWTEEAAVLDGPSGARLWPDAFARPGTGWGASKSVDDVNGDGRADLVGAVQGSLVALSGTDHAVLREHDYGGYYLTLVADVAGDPAPEYFLHGAHAAPRLVRRSDFGEAWAAPAGAPQSGGLGTVVRCAGDARFVAGLAESPGTRVYDAASGRSWAITG